MNVDIRLLLNTLNFQGHLFSSRLSLKYLPLATMVVREESLTPQQCHLLSPPHPTNLSFLFCYKNGEKKWKLTIFRPLIGYIIYFVLLLSWQAMIRCN